ncbi:MAG: lysophospholipid acyltransferase family protein [Chloroflexota bacterium]
MTTNPPEQYESAFQPFKQNPKAKPLLVWFGQLGLRLFGWQASGQLPDTDRFVVIGAPHTSNWDLPIAFCLMLIFGKKPRWMMKASMFWPPLGWFFKAAGGIPIDRSKNHNLVSATVDEFANHEDFIVGITPEGTRSKVPYWKTGFYYIAYQAKVPIVLGYFDYKRKIAGLGPAIFPSGDIEADQKKFRQFYAQIAPKHPTLYKPAQFSAESIKRFQDSISQSE